MSNLYPQVQQEFIEQRAMTTNFNRQILRSQGKLESSMEHVSRIQEKLEDTILATRDSIVNDQPSDNTLKRMYKLRSKMTNTPALNMTEIKTMIRRSVNSEKVETMLEQSNRQLSELKLLLKNQEICRPVIEQLDNDFSKNVLELTCDQNQYLFRNSCYDKHLAMTFGGKYDQWVPGEVFQVDCNECTKSETSLQRSMSFNVPDLDNRISIAS